MNQPTMNLMFRQESAEASGVSERNGASKMIQKYAYSYDREDYSGAFGSPEQACQAAVANGERFTCPPTTVYVGEIVEADPQAADHASTIVDNMSQRAHVDFGEPAARYLRNVTPAERRELDGALEQTILSWLLGNKLMPTFVRVRGIREYPAPFPKADVRRGGEASEVNEIGVPDQPQDCSGT